jgi:hypothetical protein
VRAFRRMRQTTVRNTRMAQSLDRYLQNLARFVTLPNAVLLTTRLLKLSVHCREVNDSDFQDFNSFLS